MSLLLTDNPSPRSSDGMMPEFLVEEGRVMEKLVIVAISLNLLTECLLDEWTANSNDAFCLHFYIRVFFSNLGRKCIISDCLLYTSPSPRDRQKSRMPSSA